MNDTHAPTAGRGEPTHYEIRLAGHLDQRWAEWFDGLTLTYQSDGTLLGTTEFQFGSNLFRSTSCEGVSKNGTRAQIQGSGTINGIGSYRFKLIAMDGGSTGTDRIRMRIWSKDTGNLVYDNQMGSSDDGGTGSALTAGSIVIV